MTRTVVNLVTEHGADPKGVADSSPAVAAAVADATTNHLPIYAPGATSTFRVTKTMAMKGVSLFGDGGKFKRTNGCALPTPGQGNHLATWTNFAAPITLTGLTFDGNAAGQVNPFVGDNLRFQNGTAAARITIADVKSLNMRGLTTLSTATLAETFAVQFLHLKGKVRAKNLQAQCLDGGPSATGIVSHWCDDLVLTACFSAFHQGQGFGTYGGASVATAPGTVFEGCLSSHNNHNYNIEAGDNELLKVRIGHPTDVTKACASSNGKLGLLANGTNAKRMKSLDVYDFSSLSDRSAVAGTGAIPQHFQLTRFQANDPILNVFGMLASTQNQNFLNSIGVTASHYHLSVIGQIAQSLINPKTLAKPSAWQLTAN